MCQKYGYRPLPTRVLDLEFQMICEVSAKDDVELLNKWYKLDQNSVPPKYILLKISTYYKHFCNKAQKALMEQDQGLWWKTMAQLNIIIRKATKKVILKILKKYLKKIKIFIKIFINIKAYGTKTIHG